MRLIVTTLVELSADERDAMREAGQRWAQACAGPCCRNLAGEPRRSGKTRRNSAGRLKRIARELGVLPATVWRWENGANKPTLADYEAWREIIGSETIAQGVNPSGSAAGLLSTV